VPKNHGTGEFNKSYFMKLGEGVVFESSVLLFHHEATKYKNQE